MHTLYITAFVVLATSITALIITLAPVSTVPEASAADLSGVTVDLYHSEGCTCCTGYVAALEAAGAEVTMTTQSVAKMQSLKRTHNIAHEQESCHTALIDGYVLEGHIPLEAVAEFIEEQPDVAGITLPGMPSGTPGMPGKQTEEFIVETLSGSVYWRSS